MKCGLCYINSASKKFSSNFTNYSETNNKQVCSNCFKLFDENLRKRSWIITDIITFLKQSEILPTLNNISFPCFVSFTESNKKHRRFRAKQSFSSDEIFITLDDGFIILNSHDINNINILEKYYNQYKISKKELLENTFKLKTLDNMKILVYQHIQNIFKSLMYQEKVKFAIQIINKYENRT